MIKRVNGTLLLYHHYLQANAPTIMEHVASFKMHSKFNMWAYNTEIGFPSALANLRFDSIILHYSIFGMAPYKLNDRFCQYLQESTDSFKIALFQDEYHYCQPRFDFINKFKIDCVYTLLEDPYYNEVYGKYTDVPIIRSYIPGHVSDDLVRIATEKFTPLSERKRDVGYRGRELHWYMGRGGQEKSFIADEFKRHAKDTDLVYDIETREDLRIYGPAWYDFVASSRAVLGGESGVSIFDIDDSIRAAYEKLRAEEPDLTFEQVAERLLNKYEDNIYYRMISPRHFEAAAFRVVQILFEGRYTGCMEPMVHYIPIKKDFSNFDEVVRMLKDEDLCTQITENAYRDLIESGNYNYRSFIKSFDDLMIERGLTPRLDEKLEAEIQHLIFKNYPVRYMVAYAKHIARGIISKTYDFRTKRMPGINSFIKGLVKGGSR